MATANTTTIDYCKEVAVELHNAVEIGVITHKEAARIYERCETYSYYQPSS